MFTGRAPRYLSFMHSRHSAVSLIETFLLLHGMHFQERLWDGCMRSICFLARARYRFILDRVPALAV